MTKIAIIGAGIGGLTTALALRKFRPDISVQIFERSPELKAVGAGITLAANAMAAFEQLEIHEKVAHKSTILHRVKILDKAGNIITQTDNISIDKELGTISSFSIHRAHLQALLLAELPKTTVHLGKKVTDFTQNDHSVKIQFEDQTTIETDFVIATDGIHSTFRQQLLPHSTIRYAGYTCWRGITGHIPPNFDTVTATETWGNGKRFGIVPIKGGGAYWFACINSPIANNETFKAYKKEELLNSFKGFHKPIKDLIRLTTQHDIIWNDIIDFAPIKQFAFANILLLGDAAHATTPNMGQGACQAIEGAVILAKTLQQYADIKDAFRHFEQKRLNRTAYIVNHSWQLGKIAQWQNPLATFLRNSIFRLLPAKANKKQIMKILYVKFE
jgi:2-polyprenyl-6-methoxyphenol hydroxylase-like FAD-dependent oxidoreductase